MNTLSRYVGTMLAVMTIGGAIVSAPITTAANHSATTSPTATSSVPAAGTDPLVPFGTDPQVPYRLGYVNPNHDDANTTNGELDLPF